MLLKNMKNLRIFYVILFILTSILFILLFSEENEKNSIELTFFIDKTLLPLFEEVEKSFLAQLVSVEKVDINVHYVMGSSGFVLSQMNITRQGDIYGSDDYVFAKMAVEKGLVKPESVRVIGYISLAILLPQDTKLNVNGLHDLILKNKGLKIAIGDPSHVAAGKLAEELLSSTRLWDLLWKNHDVILASSASDVASLVRTGSVDAGITFDVLYWYNPSGLRIVEIEPELNVRAAPIVVAASSFSKYPDIVNSIIEYMASEDFVKILKKYGFKTAEEMRSKYPYMRLPTLSDILGNSTIKQS